MTPTQSVPPSALPSSTRRVANLVADGATFRIWAPAARSVTLRGTFSGWNDCPMQRDAEAYWDVFVSGAREGDRYKFYVTGEGSIGNKKGAVTTSWSSPASTNARSTITSWGFPPQAIGRKCSTASVRRRGECECRRQRRTCAN